MSKINYLWRVKNALKALDKLPSNIGAFEYVQSFDFPAPLTILGLKSHLKFYIHN